MMTPMTDRAVGIEPQRLLVFQTLLIFTVAGCLLFGALNISRGIYPLAAIELMMGGVSVWLFVRSMKDGLTQNWLMVYLALFFSAMMAAIATPESSPTVFVWVFLIPLVSHLLLGARRGLIFSLLFLSVAAVTYFYRLGGSAALLEPVAIANVVVCAVLLTGLSYAYESAREKTERRLQELASTDPLTGLPNRSMLEPALQRQIGDAARRRTPFAMLSMDLDHFKTINDQRGHEAGDRALLAFADLLRQRLRASDLPCRWGGEEFQVLLSDTEPDGAARIAEEIRSSLENMRVELDDGELVMTVSIGVASYPLDAEDPASLLIMADRRLYQAKVRGRNQVVDSRSLPVKWPEAGEIGEAPG
ncbi:GGDEF domain-containing protein [Aquisalimonas sp. 2447]|uniref:GGDEF domain-containing protein n=1 Tax=Aquisalimonas sp. 2447 TaxID=2740807 RepID=UPI0014323031|nr:GGDEF domain-containing protein [Aquisalimonas sp. 2447]QIT54777.1 GGDEF domain-containing protein [Aquisalimonas sp. 2447]